jgi:4-hydroxybenzoate polyprenyltransferase
VSGRDPSTAPAPAPPSGARRRLAAALRTLRPHQWVKNLFVAAPLIFSRHLFDLDLALRSAAAVALFCAASGAVYALNDLRDLEADRRHPVKRNRPIAAGELPERAAMMLIAGLTVVALGGAALVAPVLSLVIAAYLVNNLAYSFGLKNVAILDVLMIAAGFLLRVYGGALAIDVETSPWLLACTGLLAALLGFGKRAHELAMTAREEVSETRASLAGYRRGTLTLILLTLAMATIAAYALYTQHDRTVLLFGTRSLIWTLPFCIVGIARFLQLALSERRLLSPTEAMLRDPLFLANIALWAVAVIAILY